MANPLLTELYGMHTYRRPGNSPSELEWIKKYILSLHDDGFFVERDDYNNYFVSVGSEPTVMWTAHTDTVHDTPGRQLVATDNKGRMILSPDEPKKECLGADDGAGVFVMRHMIKRKVPGLYCFFRNEEIGRLGSQWFAKNFDEEIKTFKAVISLDRHILSKHSIITHQNGGRRCCSETFADSLADSLPALNLKSDPGGSYTDSASFTDLVGECTNLSVGYTNQHTARETLDTDYVLLLLDQLSNFDEANLQFERKPGEVEYRTRSGGRSNIYYGWSDDGDYYGGESSKDWDDYYANKYPHAYPNVPLQSETKKRKEDEVDTQRQITESFYFQGMTDEDVVANWPEVVIAMFEEMGMSVDDLKRYVYQCYEMSPTTTEEL